MSDEPTQDDAHDAPTTRHEAGDADTAVQPAAPAAGPATAATAEPQRHTGRVVTARILVVLATLLGIVAIFASWARQQLLDTDQWTKTSTELLQDPQIRDQVSTYLVDELYANVNVSQEIQGRLPNDLQPLAPVIAGGVRNLLDKVSQNALERPAVQGLWTDANRVAHEQLVRVIDGGGGNVSTTGGVVTLDLRGILTNIAARLGLPGKVVAKIPPSAGTITVLKSDELGQAQDAAKALDTLGYWLGFICILLFAIAVWLAVGRRRQTLMFAGFGLIAAGLVVAVGRGAIGSSVVDALVPTAAVKPAASSAWSIGTSLLNTLAWQAIILGIATVIAAWLGGPSRPATSIRRSLAPVLKDRPEIVFLVVAALYLLLVVWAPIPAFNRPLFLLVLAVLLAAGVWILRREVEHEFPEASLDTAGSETAGGGGALRRGGAAAAGLASSAAAKATARTKGTDQGDTTVGASGDAEADRLAKLERLTALRDGGALSEEEFAAEKARLMGD